MSQKPHPIIVYYQPTHAFIIFRAVEYRANLYTRLTMAKRRKERRSRSTGKKAQPALIVKRLDQRKVRY